MKPRLSRPLLAVVLSGALLGGGAFTASPAFADPPAVPDSTTTEPGTGTPPGQEPPAVDPEPGDTGTAVPPPANNTPGDSPANPDPANPDPANPDPANPGSGNPANPGTGNPANPGTGNPANPGTGGNNPSDPDPEPTDDNPGPQQPPADTTKPTGVFAIDRWTIWIGQSITVTVSGVSDGDQPAADVTKVLTWGDGTSTKLTATQTKVTHQYTKLGKMPVTLTLTDKAGNKFVRTSSGPTVVTPGKFKVSKASIWHGERFTVSLVGVPAGTTKVVLYWGDGRTTTVSGKSQSVTKWYWTDPSGYIVDPGAYTLRAVYHSKYGQTIPLYAGKVTVKRDAWAPTVKITKPKNPTKASSWKTLQGTVADKGSGIRVVELLALRPASGGRVACYTAKKTWITVKDDNSNVLSCIIPVRVSKGKYSLALKGVKKGYFLVSALAYDWADNDSKEATYETTLK